MLTLIFVGVFIVILMTGIILYNHLVKNSHLVKEAWSDIDVQLKRRHSLIPNLSSAVKAYADYESSTLERIIHQRQPGDGPETPRGEAESQLSRELRKLIAVAESYPELKANQGFLSLMQNLSDLEEKIQYARRYYNGTVRNLNVLIESFPSNMIAQLFRFRKANYFEIELATAREIPELDL